MKRGILCLVCVSLAMFRMDAEDCIINENFNDPQQDTKTYLSTLILKQGGLDGKGVLNAIGNGEANQYPATFKPVPVKAGESYGFSFNYKTGNDLPNSSAIFAVSFLDSNGKTAGQKNIVLYKSEEWKYICEIIPVPGNAATMQIKLRLNKVPDTAQLFFDNIKLAALKDNKDFFMTDFKTVFEPWDDSQKLFEHFSFGEGGKILNDWKQAKVGEACLTAVGNDKTMQFPFWIYKIKADEKRIYSFEFEYRTIKENAVFDSNAMLIFYFKDANNKAVGQFRIGLTGTNGDWKTLKKEMTTPEGTQFIDMCLNLRNVTPNTSIYIDNVNFHAEDSRSFIKFSIDPENKKLAASCSVTSDIAPENIKSSKIIVLKDNIEKSNNQTPLNTELVTDISAWEDGE